MTLVEERLINDAAAAAEARAAATAEVAAAEVAKSVASGGWRGEEGVVSRGLGVGWPSVLVTWGGWLRGGVCVAGREQGRLCSCARQRSILNCGLLTRSYRI